MPKANAEETRNGLVRRQIMTKKGNRVWRWVKPDNPNIGQEERGQGLAAARANRRATTIPKPEVVPEPPKPQFNDFGLISLAGCCGGRWAPPKPPSHEPPKTDEEYEAAWKQSSMYQNWLSYSQTLQNIDAGVETLKSGKKIPAGNPYSYYNDYGVPDAIRYLEADRRTYETGRTRLSLEHFKKFGDPNQIQYLYKNGAIPNQMGIVASSEPFNGATETPAGLWVRGDYFWRYKGMEAFMAGVAEAYPPVPAVAQPDCKAFAQSYKGANRVTAYTSYVPGIHLLYLGGRSIPSGGLWNFIRSKDSGIKPGDTVLFIRNKLQMDEGVMADMAAGGFQCVLVTGNRNHPLTSVLHLFERKLTEADFE